MTPFGYKFNVDKNTKFNINIKDLPIYDCNIFIEKINKQL